MLSEAADPTGRMRHDALGYCALALLRDGERGAFELVRALAGEDGLARREGTVYPLLARMRRDGLVSTSWQEDEPGRPHRCYRITPEGRQALKTFVDEWLLFRGHVDAFLGTGAEGT